MPSFWRGNRITRQRVPIVSRGNSSQEQGNEKPGGDMRGNCKSSQAASDLQARAVTQYGCACLSKSVKESQWVLVSVCLGWERDLYCKSHNCVLHLNNRFKKQIQSLFSFICFYQSETLPAKIIITSSSTHVVYIQIVECRYQYLVLSCCCFH